MDLKKILKLFEAPVGPGAIASTAKASGIANPNLIKPGQQIRIPMQGGGEVYQTVKKGDTLSGMISRAQQTQDARAASIKPAVAPKPAVAGSGSAPTTTSSYTGTRTQPTADAPAASTTASAQRSADSDTAKQNLNIGASVPGAGPDTSTAAGALAAMGQKGSATSTAPAAPTTPPAATTTTATDSGSSMTNPANAAQGQTGAGSSSYTNPAGLSGIDNTKPVQPTAAPTVSAGGGTLQSAGGNVTSRDFSKPQTDAMGRRINEVDLDEEDNIEEQIEEAFNDMLRLSGIQLNEKAVSRQQQKFMGMVHAMQKGERVKGASPELKKVAKTMGKKDAKDFASTKHKGLPQKVSESIMLEAGSNLEHIVTRFKHETKNFLNGAELDEDLYNALYDYYVDNGEMPYGVAKAREGDPYQWVSDHFADELALLGHQRQFQETVIPVVDNQLSELARLAGLSEGRVDECGDMGMDQRDSMNVSTNMSSDGTKSVTISAQGDQAEALIQMLKLAGMGHMGHSQDDKPVMVVSKDDEEMMDEEYKNSPDEEYHSIDSIIHQGNDLNREKRQYADKPKLGDNPMSEEIVDEELQGLLDSVLIKADKDIKEIPPDPKTGRVRVEYPPVKSSPPDQSELPLQKEPFHGPRSVKIDGEKTNTNKEVDEGSIEKSGPNDLTGTWSSNPPKKGQPDVDPPVPMDPVYPAAKMPRAPSAPVSPAVPRSGIKK